MSTEGFPGAIDFVFNFLSTKISPATRNTLLHRGSCDEFKQSRFSQQRQQPHVDKNTTVRRRVDARGGGGHTSISLTGMLVREQISTTQKNRMTLHSNLKKIECPEIQTQKDRMTQDAMFVKA